MRQRAFTLMELLIVITIIALLASMTMVASKMVLDAARAARCLSNVRQLSLASLAYTQDWNGWVLDYGNWRYLVVDYVSATQTGGTGTSKAGGSVLQDCPSWRGNANMSSGSGQFGLGRRGQGYSYNPWPGKDAHQIAGQNDSRSNTIGYPVVGSPGWTSFRLARITLVAKRLQFFDADTYLIDPIPSRRVLASDDKSGGPRHRRRAAWSFFDGHAAMTTTEEQKAWDQGDYLNMPVTVAGLGSLSGRWPAPGTVMWNAVNSPGRNP